MALLDEDIRLDPQPEKVAQPLLLLAVAAMTGIVAEIALHNWVVDGGLPGLGIPMAITVAVVGFALGGRALGSRPDRSSTTLYAAAIVFAMLIALRSSGPLIALNLLSSFALIGLAVTYHNPSATRPRFLFGFARTASRVCLQAGLGGLFVAMRDLPNLEDLPFGKLRRIALGAVIAFPFLFVFGALFASADAVFDDVLRGIAGFDVPEAVAAGSVFAGLISWTHLGLMRGVVTAAPTRRMPAGHLHLGPTETSTAMWLINGLFSLFVAFQIVEVVLSYQSERISYADQARSGFFELVTVAALVVAAVLLLDWAVDRIHHPRLHRQQRVLIGLTGAVLVSAVVRMALYVHAYGLTRLRVFTTVFMLWIAFVLAWTMRTVLKGRRDRFARPAVVGLFGAVLVLNLINPDGLIASYNLGHPPSIAAQIDRGYLYGSLSADATPVLIEHLSAAGDACAQLELLQRVETAQATDLRGWNLARAHAAGLVESTVSVLAEACQSG